MSTTNENLKRALKAAGLTVERFAEIIEVDPKTVQRWVAGTTVPYQRNQETVAQALSLEPHDLWPETVHGPDEPLPRLDDGAGPGDIVGSWGQYGQPGQPELIELVARASHRIDVRHEGRLLRLPDTVIDAIADRARAGCRVRVITQSPTPELAALIGLPRAEVRVSRAVSDTCLVRCDDEILLFLPLATSDRLSPALVHLHRRTDRGLFDRFIEHLEFEEASDRTTGPLTSQEQIEPYRPGAPGDRHDLGPVRPQRTDSSGPTDEELAAGPAESGIVEGRDGGRRWPRHGS